MGWAILAVAWWELEQQSEELPFCASEQQQSRQSAQQYWFSYWGLPAEHSSIARVVEWEFIKGAIEEFSPIPAISATISKYYPAIAPVSRNSETWGDRATFSVRNKKPGF